MMFVWKCSILLLVLFICCTVESTSSVTSITGNVSTEIFGSTWAKVTSPTSAEDVNNITSAVSFRTSPTSSFKTSTASSARTSQAFSSRTSAASSARTSQASSSRTSPASSARTSQASSSRTSPASSSRTYFEGQDYVLTEIVRLVFKGDVAREGFPDVVYGLTESFLTRATREVKAEDGSDWAYELSSTLQPINFENLTTYMDFRIKHTAQTAISTVFDRLGFRRFISQNSHLVLLGECWPHNNCQNSSANSQQQEVEESLNVFTTFIVLSSLCLVIILTAVVCSCLKRMDSSKKDTDFETKDFVENSQRILVKSNSCPESAAVPAQAVQTSSFYASAADEDEDVETLHSTWVIPLDEAPGGAPAVLVVTAEDTKL